MNHKKADKEYMELYYDFKEKDRQIKSEFIGLTFSIVKDIVVIYLIVKLISLIINK